MKNVKMPGSYWVNNGQLAEKMIVLLAREKSEDPELTLDKIKKIILDHKQRNQGESTFAKGFIELLEEVDAIKVDYQTKLKLIFDTAKITVDLRNLLAGPVN